MTEENTNTRLEAFCDAVFSIALTLLILEIKTPLAENIHSSDDLWTSLRHLLPSLFAFLLSFIVIIVSWVNHHATMKLVNKHTPYFIYANVFLLLTIVIIPFTTALLAEFCFTDAATPAVALYSFVILLTNIGWIFLTRTALQPHALTKSEAATLMMKRQSTQAKMAFVLYALCTVLAFWFPIIIAVVISLTFLAWLILGLSYGEKPHSVKH